MRLSLAQIDSGTDKARNLELIRGFAQEAWDAGADLVAFPEFSMYEKKVVDATFSAAAEPLDGPFVESIRELAARLTIAIAVGVVETNENDPRPYNTILAVGPSGEIQARYRKIHLFDSFGFRESASISPADSLDPVVFSVAGMTVGLMTCYDLRFPELGRELADAGAELMLVCSSWVPGDGKLDQWQTLARARAIENACYVGAVSQVPPVSIGQSLLVSPMGAVLGELSTAPAIATFDVERGAVAAAREKNPALEHRRYSIRRESPAGVPPISRS
jgi:predicted amidohydrolase